MKFLVCCNVWKHTCTSFEKINWTILSWSVSDVIVKWSVYCAIGKWLCIVFVWQIWCCDSVWDHQLYLSSFVQVLSRHIILSSTHVHAMADEYWIQSCKAILGRTTERHVPLKRVSMIPAAAIGNTVGTPVTKYTHQDTICTNVCLLWLMFPTTLWDWCIDLWIGLVHFGARHGAFHRGPSSATVWLWRVSHFCVYFDPAGLLWRAFLCLFLIQQAYFGARITFCVFVLPLCVVLSASYIY